jgi:hypothetical protein
MVEIGYEFAAPVPTRAVARSVDPFARILRSRHPVELFAQFAVTS